MSDDPVDAASESRKTHHQCVLLSLVGMEPPKLNHLNFQLGLKMSQEFLLLASGSEVSGTLSCHPLSMPFP